MLKVLLISPPEFNMIRTNLPKIVNSNDAKGYYPPIGLLYVAAATQDIKGVKVTVIDAVVDKLTYEQLEEKIKAEKPDVVGIQVMTFTLLDAITTADIIKKIDSNIHVCLGGPHIAIFPEETVLNKSVDTVIKGEGEKSFSELLNRIKNKRGFDGITGLYYKKDDMVVKNSESALVKDLDALKHPARLLTNYNKYWSVLSERAPITTIMSSRGCPYKCTFCDRPTFGKVIRYRSADSIVSEIEECYALGISEFVFYDDTFTVNKRRVFEFCDKIKEKRLDIVWDVRARVDTVDKEMLIKMKMAGCRRIHYGVESGVDSVLISMQKEITVSQVRQAIKDTKEIGLTTLGYFMIGNVGESISDAKQTIKLMNELPLDYVHISVLMPFPGTTVYYQGVASGVYKTDYWKEYALKPNQDFIPQLWQEEIKEEELYELLKYAYKSFYKRPSYILRQLFKIRTMTELKRKVNTGLRILFGI